MAHTITTPLGTEVFEIDDKIYSGLYEDQLKKASDAPTDICRRGVKNRFIAFNRHFRLGENFAEVSRFLGITPTNAKRLIVKVYRDYKRRENLVSKGYK